MLCLITPFAWGEEGVVDINMASGRFKIKDNATLKDIIWVLNEVGVFCFDEVTVQKLKDRGCFEIKEER